MGWVVLLIAAGVIAMIVGVCGILSKTRWGGFLTVVGVLLGGAGLALLTISFGGKQEPSQWPPAVTPPRPPGVKVVAPTRAIPGKN